MKEDVEKFVYELVFIKRQNKSNELKCLDVINKISESQQNLMFAAALMLASIDDRQGEKTDDRLH